MTLAYYQFWQFSVNYEYVIFDSAYFSGLTLFLVWILVSISRTPKYGRVFVQASVFVTDN
jgi:hypothetical protein